MVSLELSARLAQRHLDHGFADGARGRTRLLEEAAGHGQSVAHDPFHSAGWGGVSRRRPLRSRWPPRYEHLGLEPWTRLPLTSPRATTEGVTMTNERPNVAQRPHIVAVFGGNDVEDGLAKKARTTSR